MPHLGDWYEVANGVVKQYYSIGGVRVAMRDSGMASAPLPPADRPPGKHEHHSGKHWNTG